MDLGYWDFLPACLCDFERELPQGYETWDRRMHSRQMAVRVWPLVWWLEDSYIRQVKDCAGTDRISRLGDVIEVD